MLFIALLSVAAATISASPIEIQPRTTGLSLKHVSHVKSIKNVVTKGRARINKINGVSNINADAADDASSGSITNEDQSYVAPVSIGGTTYQLIVDTGCKITLLL